MFDFAGVTPGGIREEVARAVEQAEGIASRITHADTPSTYQDIIAPLDDIIDLIRTTQHHTELMRQVHPDSKVREAGVFSRFEEEGITSPEVGRAYREKVIGRGGSVDPNDMLVDFLGRKPDNEAFLRKVGIG